MNEQETLNSILGFDPTTGRRLDDNYDHLRPVGEIVVPAEIQSSFVKWVEEQPYVKDVETKVVPNRLFVAIKGKWKIVRLYYSWNQSLSPEEQTFPRHTQAEFTDAVVDEDHKYEPFAVHYFDEHDREGDDRNSISLRYSNSGEGTILLGVHVWLVKDGRTLYVEDLENVSEVRFTEGDGKQDIFELYLARAGYFNFDGIVLEDNDERVLMMHKAKGLIDNVQILKPNEDREILDKLFEDAILNDPFNVPCSFDDSWRFADIRGISGIKWEVEGTC